MSKEKERDYLCLFRSKFDVMLKLSDIGLREMTQAMYDFLEGKNPVFSDSQAQALWWTWSLEFNTAKENYKNKCEKNKQRARERWEQNKVGTENMPTHANACQRIPTHANAYTGIENMPTHTNDAYTETETETETETDNIFIENKNIYNNAPTKEKILQLAKDPSVALSPEEAEKFFDHYTAQSWTRSNGQAIANTPPALISMLRMWKSNSVNFAPRQQTFSYGYSKSQGDGISLKEFKRKFVKLFDPNFMDVDADATDYLSQMILFVRRMQAEESIEEFKQKYFNEYTTIINRKDI